jgi:hypothetical protein
LQKVARTTSGVIRVSDLSCGRALSSRATVTTMRILALMAQETLIVSAATLPAEFTWATSEWPIASVALVMLVAMHVVAAGATH